MEFIRPAGLNELRCIAREDLKLYGSIISIAEYAGPSELHEVHFFKALKQCITEHPALAIVIHDADTEHPTLNRVEHIDLTKHFHMRDGGIRQFLEDCHNESFVDRSERPQWRVVVQPTIKEAQINTFSFHMAFVCSHNIADGMSGPQFHTTFLQALNNSKEDSFDGLTIWQPPKDPVLPPPLEHAGKLTISWKFLLGPLLNEYLPATIATVLGFGSTAKEEVWQGASTRPHQIPLTSLVPTKSHHISISAETLNAVLTASRGHTSRLTGLLSHLTSRAVARGLATRGQTYQRFAAGIPINMRRALKRGEGQMANYPSSTEEVISVAARHLTTASTTGMTTEDWNAVAATTKSLEEKSSTLADQPVGLLTYLNDFRGWNAKNAAAPAKISFEVSNVGALDGGGGGGGDWKIRDLVFSQSADASGPPMSVCVASTKGGQLNLVFVWSPGAFALDDEMEFMEKVAGDVEGELNHIANEVERCRTRYR